MLAVLRFTLYQTFSSTAKLFIDREVKRHQDKIFSALDRELWQGNSANPMKEEIMGKIIMGATKLASVDTRQIQQVRDLFDPLAFAQRLLK